MGCGVNGSVREPFLGLGLALVACWQVELAEATAACQLAGLCRLANCGRALGPLRFAPASRSPLEKAAIAASVLASRAMARWLVPGTASTLLSSMSSRPYPRNGLFVAFVQREDNELIAFCGTSGSNPSPTRKHAGA